MRSIQVSRWPSSFHFEIAPGVTLEGTVASLLVQTSSGIPVFMQHNRLTDDEFGAISGDGVFICNIERLPLPPAMYLIDYSIVPNNGRHGQCYDSLENAVELKVTQGSFF